MQLELVGKLSLVPGNSGQRPPGTHRRKVKLFPACPNPGEAANFALSLRAEGDMKKAGKPRCKG